MAIYLIVNSVSTWVIFPKACALYSEEEFY